MEVIHIEYPEIPPGFRFRIRIQGLRPRGVSPLFSPNPATDISKQIKIFKRKLSKLRQRRNELLPHSPFQYAYTLATYKANLMALYRHLHKIRHFVA